MRYTIRLGFLGMINISNIFGRSGNPSASQADKRTNLGRYGTLHRDMVGEIKIGWQ